MPLCFVRAYSLHLPQITPCSPGGANILVESASHPTPTVNEVRFFLNQFRKGDVNDLKYRQALVDTFVNKIYLYDDKMTVLYNTQDSHSDVTIDDLSSSRVALVEAGGVEPPSENV